MEATYLGDFMKPELVFVVVLVCVWKYVFMRVFYVNECLAIMHVCVLTICKYGALGDCERSADTLRFGCEPCVFWELNPRSLQEQQTLLTAKPSAHCLTLLFCSKYPVKLKKEERVADHRKP